MKISKIITLLLAGILAASLTACGESEVNTDTEKTAEAVQNPEEEVVEVEEEADDSRASVKDSLPDNLDFEGRTFTIYYFAAPGEYPEWPKFIEGGEEITGEIISDTVFNCNSSVESRLNVALDFFHNESGGCFTAPVVSNLVMSGDPLYDLFLSYQVDICTILAKGYFANTLDMDYFDFSQPWWNTSIIDNLAMDKEKQFALSGDYNLTNIDLANLVYFNKSIYQNSFGDPESLYSEAFEGKWTIDRIGQLASDAYIDLNGNGVEDEGDQFGYTLYGAASTVDGYMYSGDVQYCHREDDGRFKVEMMSDRAVTLAEKVYALYHQQGINIFNTIRMADALFAEGKALFMHGVFDNAVNLREMEDDFGLMPVPKLDEEQERYYSLVADLVLYDVFPVSSDCLDIGGAVFEALSAETYRTVTPAYYDVTLKNKYSRDLTSAKIIDIIHDASYTNFIYCYTAAIGDPGRVLRGIVGSNAPDYASVVAKNAKLYSKGVEGLYKTLDKNT